MSYTKNILMMVLMILATLIASTIKPSHRIADDMPAVTFENQIPTSFAGWEMLDTDFSQIIDPQQQEMINRIYTNTLSRTYINKEGYAVMLVLAYGVEQNDNNRLHYPEVCYPAQGFEVRSKLNDEIHMSFGTLKVKKLLAKKGSRLEPITYWTVLGDKVVRGSSELKLEQIRYGLKGKIPDGTLVRVSSIDSDSISAYKRQEQFIHDLSNAISGNVVSHIMGRIHG